MTHISSAEGILSIKAEKNFVIEIVKEVLLESGFINKAEWLQNLKNLKGNNKLLKFGNEYDFTAGGNHKFINNINNIEMLLSKNASERDLNALKGYTFEIIFDYYDHEPASWYLADVKAIVRYFYGKWEIIRIKENVKEYTADNLIELSIYDMAYDFDNYEMFIDDIYNLIGNEKTRIMHCNEKNVNLLKFEEKFIEEFKDKNVVFTEAGDFVNYVIKNNIIDRVFEIYENTEKF